MAGTVLALLGVASFWLQNLYLSKLAARVPDATLLRRFRARAFAVDRQGRLYAAAG